MTVIYDWPYSIAPISSVFRAGGQARQGGFSRGGARFLNPEPGGRATYDMAFSPFAIEADNLKASWVMSRIMNGAYMRIKLWPSVQILNATALGVSGTLISQGIPWDNGNPWDGAYWEYNPTADVSEAASRGATTVKVDMSAYGEVLKLGHVIGFTAGSFDFTHEVMDISYDGSDVATIEVSPPLRRALTTSDTAQLFPTGIFQCTNPNEVAGMYHAGRHVQFNTARMVEALV